MDTFRWGILGCGNIAKKFAEGLTAIPDAELIAVGSRTRQKADQFADQFGAPHRHASYEALVNDPDVDAIYIATPHPYHCENTLLCLEHKKPVLCEKPFSINADFARKMIACARREKVFLMEAMWTRFLPVMVKVRELLDAGAIGDIRMVIADFGFRGGWNPDGRLLNPDLAGGGLLDVGIYAVSFAGMVMKQQPSEITSMAHIGITGVDEQAAWLFKYDKGRIGIGYSAVQTTTPHEATVLGTEGQIRVEPPFWRGDLITVHAGGKVQTLDCTKTGNGYNYQAIEVMNCVRQGKLESDTMPLDETLAIIQTLDKIRQPWGLVYPQEKK